MSSREAVRVIKLVLLLLGCAPELARAQPEAEALLRRALEQHAEGRFEVSVRTLLRAEKAATDPGVHAKVWLYLGVNRTVLNEAAAARQAFAEALRIDPSLELDPDRFKPAVIRLFREVKAKQAPSPPPASRTTPEPAPASAPAIVEPPPVARPPLLRPGTRRWFASLSIGGAIGMGGAAHVQTYNGTVDIGFPSQFAAAEEIGFHFAPRSSGPGLAFLLAEAVGSFSYYTVSWSSVLVQPALRFFWDIPLGHRALYLSPSLQVGYAFWHISQVAPDPDSSLHAVVAQPALDLKLILADRVLLYFRPLAAEVVSFVSTSLPVGTTCDSVVVRYGLQVGGAVTF